MNPEMNFILQRLADRNGCSLSEMQYNLSSGNVGKLLDGLDPDSRHIMQQLFTHPEQAELFARQLMRSPNIRRILDDASGRQY